MSQDPYQRFGNSQRLIAHSGGFYTRLSLACPRSMHVNRTTRDQTLVTKRVPLLSTSR